MMSNDTQTTAPCRHCREDNDRYLERMMMEHPEYPNPIIARVRNAENASDSESRFLIGVIVFLLVALLSPILFEWLSR